VTTDSGYHAYTGTHGHYHTPYAAWDLVTGPVGEPVTLAECKQHARILYNDDDAVQYRFLKTAREEAEEYMQRGLLTQTWRLALQHFYEIMFLPMAAPLQSVTSVTYYDANGVQQTLAPTVYTVDTYSRPGSVIRAANQIWPVLQTDRRLSRVVITYVVGWTSAALVPERIKQGIRSYVAYLDADREGLEENQDRALTSAKSCWQDRVFWLEPHGYAGW
jgi:uncharacterized phiE125 gp8 family phage protein